MTNPSPEIADPINDYKLYRVADYNRPEYFPVQQTVPSDLYRPAATWMGRMILPQPDQRRKVKGALFEVYHADEAHQHLVGKVVNLRYSDDPEVQVRVWSVTKNVYFDEKTMESEKQGLIHPDRINTWRLVNPLESLAGALPDDVMIVSLRDPVTVEESGESVSLYISREPVQITGRFMGLVTFIGPVGGDSDQFKVKHFNRETRQFDGPEEVVRLTEVKANVFDLYQSISKGIETSPLNAKGWYIYGATDPNGVFVVQALAPRALFSLEPDETILDKKEALKYAKKGVWKDAPAYRRKTTSVLLSPKSQTIEEAVAQWQEGDKALLVTVYGGVGGKRREPNASYGGIYFGHFAYGTARVIREPLSGELRFDIVYHQVFTNNLYGLVPGNLHWTRYMGDRQWGFLGLRPVADILLKLDAFTDDYEVYDQSYSVLDMLAWTLESMTARYRIGDGSGGTYMTAANNCAQDSNQALYATIMNFDSAFKTRPRIKQWLEDFPQQVDRFERLLTLGEKLRGKLLPFGSARADWSYHIENLGSNLSESTMTTLVRGVASWRTLLPCVAFKAISQVFIEQGASAWVLRTNQIGGDEPDIEPLAPFPCG